MDAKVALEVPLSVPTEAMPDVIEDAVNDWMSVVKNCENDANTPPAVEVPVTVVDPK